MSSLHILARLQRSLGKRGVLASLRHYSLKIYQLIRPPRIPDHPFDYEHGVDTSGLIEGLRLGAGHANDIYNTAYYGSAPSAVRLILEQWKTTLEGGGPGVSDYTFIDVGAGKGRVLLMASELPFREIIGVELSAKLAATAQRNIDLWQTRERACKRIRAMQGDATEFALPEAPFVVYLFNPFEAAVMTKFLERLQAAAEDGSSPIDILYVHPVHSAVLDGWPSLSSLGKALIYLSATDTEADAFHSGNIACNIYRFQYRVS